MTYYCLSSGQAEQQDAFRWGKGPRCGNKLDLASQETAASPALGLIR